MVVFRPDGSSDGDTTSDRFCESLSAHSKQQIIPWLEQLETLGFIADATPEPTETAIVAEQIIAVLKEVGAGAKVLA